MEEENDTLSYPSTENQPENPIDSFIDSYSLNHERVMKYKRRRRMVVKTNDIIGPPMMLTLLSFIGYIFFDDGGFSQISFVIALLCVSFVIVIGIFAFIVQLWAWRSDLTPETVAGFALSEAIQEYRTGDEYDSAEVMQSLRETKEFLEIAHPHRNMPSFHAGIIGEYVERLENAVDREAAIEQSFPHVSRFAVNAFLFLSNSQIEEHIYNIETVTTSPGAIQGLKTDMEDMVQFLFTGRAGAVTLATLTGILIGFYFGFWRGLSVFFGVATIYLALRE